MSYIKCYQCNTFKMRLRNQKLSKLQNVSVFINFKHSTTHGETIFN